MKAHPHAPLTVMLAANLTAVWIAMSAGPAPAAPAGMQAALAAAAPAPGRCAVGAEAASTAEVDAPPLAASY